MEILTKRFVHKSEIRKGIEELLEKKQVRLEDVEITVEEIINNRAEGFVIEIYPKLDAR